MKKNDLVILLCVITLMGSAAGCKADKNSSADSTVKQSQSIEYETIVPPENGWTKQQIFDTAYIVDRKISLPVNIRSLGEDFKFDEKSIKVNESKHYAKAELLYKNKFLGNVRIENVDSISDIDEETPLTVLLINSDTCEAKSCEPVIVNGIKLGDHLDEALSAMGDNYEKNGDVYTFKDAGSGSEACNFVFRNDTLITVIFHFKTT